MTEALKVSDDDFLTDDLPMLERAARRLHTLNTSRMVVQPAWDQLSKDKRLAYRNGARFVLSPLMQPSEAKVEAGINGVDWPDMPAGSDPEEICRTCWQAMLKAILQERETGE